MQISKFMVVVTSLIAVAALTAGCGAKRESFDVTIAYVLEPTEALPEGLTTVAVLDAGTKIDGSEDDDRSKKWSKIAADEMETLITEAAKKHGSPLTIAKRRETTKIMAEQDMKAAGLVDAGTAAQTGKLLDVQALITSELNIRVEVKEGKKSTFDITHIAAAAGHGWGAGSGSMGAREADEISRAMMLQCKFAMVDAATSDAYFDYTSSFRKHDHKSPGAMFGRSASEASLDSVDMAIGDLVMQGVREFVSTFVPCEVTYAYHLESSKTEASAAGVAALRADDYETAMAHFEAAMAEDPEDHRSVFCMGVLSELTGDWDAALKQYRRVCGMRGVDEDQMAMYINAKNRVDAHKDRIRKAK